MTELRIALPSKGSLHEPTVRFLQGCGLSVRRESNRHYLGELGGGLGAVQVLFLHAQEIPGKVAEGTCEAGFTGVDLIRDSPSLARNLVYLFEDLGFGRARLVLAVPETWHDVESLADLVELSAQWRDERGVKIRVATKFTHLTRAFLLASGISDHTIVRSSGSTELSSWLKDADMISDLTSTGTTLAANRLMEIREGTILQSQTCLIGNRGMLLHDKAKLRTIRRLLDRIEARLRAQNTLVIEATCSLAKWEAAAQADQDLAQAVVSLQKLDRTTSQLTMHVAKSDIDKVMRSLRKLDLKVCRASEPTFLFTEKEQAYQQLLKMLRQGRLEV